MANITLSDEVADVLGRSTITGNRLTLPPGRLDRPTSEAVNKALTAAGGKWQRSVQAHVFDGDPRPKLGLMLETGVAVDEKKLFQAFFTPAALADQLASLADVAGKTVLEPSAGHGALADACLRHDAAAVECVELNPEAAARLEAKGYAVRRGDSLSMRSEPLYERVVMNPPFTRDQDVRHVRHALGFLKPGGLLAAVMAGNTARPKFRALLADLDLYRLVPVPAGAFKEAGTSVSTVLLLAWPRPC